MSRLGTFGRETQNGDTAHIAELHSYVDQPIGKGKQKEYLICFKCDPNLDFAHNKLNVCFFPHFSLYTCARSHGVSPVEIMQLIKL